MTSELKNLISAEYGDRCPEFDEDCPTCKIWREYDIHATPSADPLAGLVRWKHCEYPNQHKMMEHRDGEYILYSEAEKIVASKDAEINKLNVYNGSYHNQIIELRELIKDAESELVDIKSDALKWREHQQSIREYMEEWSKFTDEQEKFENGK